MVLKYQFTHIFQHLRFKSKSNRTYRMFISLMFFLRQKLITYKLNTQEGDNQYPNGKKVFPQNMLFLCYFSVIDFIS